LLFPRFASGFTGHGGLTFEFLLALDTEAPSEFFFYIKELRAASMAEDAVHSQHNVYSLRGAKLREPLVWSKSLKRPRCAGVDRSTRCTRRTIGRFGARTM
jgi:alkyl sulfatase BDS1-like metallo-beta-lactamase superfamily hydrolase